MLVSLCDRGTNENSWMLGLWAREAGMLTCIVLEGNDDATAGQ